MTQWQGQFSGRSNVSLRLDLFESGINEGLNQSTVDIVVFLHLDNTTYRPYSSNPSYWSATVNGVGYSGSYTYNFSGQSSGYTITLLSTQQTITHNADGSKTISGSASSNADSPLGSASVSGSLALENFVMPPYAPATAPTLSRSTDGGSITVTSAVPTSEATITSYSFARSTNNSSFTATSMGNSTTYTWTNADPTTAYYIKTRANSSKGSGEYSPTAYIAGVPTAPASIGVSRNIRNVTVTAGSSPSGNGSNITGYKVQYSTDNGSTWSTVQSMTSQTYTYVNLTPGATYLFRVYASNAIGNSTVTTSESVSIPSSARRWDDETEEFVITETAKRWTGSAWVDISTAKRFTGSEWVSLS